MPSARWSSHGCQRLCGSGAWPRSMQYLDFLERGATARRGAGVRQRADDQSHAVLAGRTSFYPPHRLCRRPDGDAHARDRKAAADLVGRLLDRTGALHHRALPARCAARAQALGPEDPRDRYRHLGHRQGRDRHLSRQRAQRFACCAAALVRKARWRPHRGATGRRVAGLIQAAQPDGGAVADEGAIRCDFLPERHDLFRQADAG